MLCFVITLIIIITRIEKFREIKCKKIVSTVAPSLKNNIYVQFGLNNPCIHTAMNFNPCVSVRRIIVYFILTHIKKEK